MRKEGIGIRTVCYISSFSLIKNRRTKSIHEPFGHQSQRRHHLCPGQKKGRPSRQQFIDQ